MNKARLIKNRLTIKWTGTSKLKILDIENINRKRSWIRLNKKNHAYMYGILKYFKNEEYD